MGKVSLWAWSAIAAAPVLSLPIMLQEAGVARIAAAASTAFAAAYAFMRATGVLLPRRLAREASLTSTGRVTCAAWRNRVLSTVNACVLVTGALLCFSGRSEARSREAWLATDAWLPNHPATFVSIFVGYLNCDLCWVLWHQREFPDVPHIFHHVIYLTIAHLTLHGWHFDLPFEWFTLAELSTPLLNLRGFLMDLGYSSGLVYTLASAAFALTFLVLRVGSFAIGLYELWAARPMWARTDAPPGMAIVVLGWHAGFAFNLYFARLIVAALVQVATGRTGDEKAA